MSTRVNKTNKTTPVSADELLIYDSQDTSDDKNITLGQVATFTENQNSTVAGTKIFSSGVDFQKGFIAYGQYSPLPTGIGSYVAGYTHPTYGTRLLGYNGLAYQDLNIGSMPTAGSFSIKSLANGDCNFGYNVNVAEDLGVTGSVTANKFYGDGSELTDVGTKNVTQIGTCSTASYTVLTGAISWTSGSTTVTGSGTAFLTEIKVGDSLAITEALGRRVASIESNTSLTLETAAGDTYTYTGLHCYPHEKNVTLDGFSLITGATIQVTFTNANTSATPTLNVNATGAKAIYNEAGTAVSATNPAYFPAGSTVEFTYNGTNWVFKKRVTENYVNGASWYRVWSDGWIEQGGKTPVESIDTSITFLKSFLNSNYFLSCNNPITSGAALPTAIIRSQTSIMFSFHHDSHNDSNNNWATNWIASGY